MNKRPNTSTVVKDLDVGGSIFVSYVNWHEEGDYELTECGTEEQLRNHFVEGIVQSVVNKRGKVKKIFNFSFPALEEFHSFSVNELQNHPNTYFSLTDLPEGAFVMKTKGDLNPLVLSVEELPAISENDMQSVPELVRKFIEVAGRRDQAMKEL